MHEPSPQPYILPEPAAEAVRRKRPYRLSPKGRLVERLGAGRLEPHARLPRPSAHGTLRMAPSGDPAGRPYTIFRGGSPSQSVVGGPYIVRGRTWKVALNQFFTICHSGDEPKKSFRINNVLRNSTNRESRES